MGVNSFITKPAVYHNSQTQSLYMDNIYFKRTSLITFMLNNFYKEHLMQHFIRSFNTISIQCMIMLFAFCHVDIM